MTWETSSSKSSLQSARAASVKRTRERGGSSLSATSSLSLVQAPGELQAFSRTCFLEAASPPCALDAGDSGTRTALGGAASVLRAARRRHWVKAPPGGIAYAKMNPRARSVKWGPKSSRCYTRTRVPTGTI